MKAREKIQRGYQVNLRQADDSANQYQVSYVSHGLQQARMNGGASKRVPEFKAIARVQDQGIEVIWKKTPADPEATQQDFEQDARLRVRLLHDWIKRLTPLVSSIGYWAKELGWSVRPIDKLMRDSEIGDYRAPGLLMQEETTKVALEPIGRTAPGVEGVADLYLLPAYDDIATLYYYNHRWNVHSMPLDSEADTIRDAPSKPLSKKTLREVLDEMKKHVG